MYVFACVLYVLAILHITQLGPRSNVIHTTICKLMANILNCVMSILYEFKVLCSHFGQSKVRSWKSYWTERNHKGTSRDDCKLNLVRCIWILY